MMIIPNGMESHKIRWFQTTHQKHYIGGETTATRATRGEAAPDILVQDLYVGNWKP